MDFVEGRVVEDFWNSLTETERVEIVNQTASILNTLQFTPVPQDPGPVGCKICLAQGFWFSSMGGRPFNLKKDLEDWFNRKLTICQHFKQSPSTLPQFRIDKLVLTYQDIAPRNLILGPDDKVWLVDWGYAGRYSEGSDAASLSVRRYSAPLFTDMLLEMNPKHVGLTEQLKWIVYALTTGQFIYVLANVWQIGKSAVVYPPSAFKRKIFTQALSSLTTRAH
ncbi:hypothetical protein RJZ56_001821 [Blastomyces dermatitidis]